MGCPECKSENIKYYKKRQTQPGTVPDDILCVCQQCGHKWKKSPNAVTPARQLSRPNVQVNSVPQPARRRVVAESVEKKPEWTKQEKMLQRILAVLLWPVTITYWFYENRAIELKKQSRIAVICVGWVLFAAAVFGVAYIAAHPKPKVVLDYSVSTTVNVSTAQFATTTAPKSTKPADNASAASTTAATTVNSIFS